LTPGAPAGILASETGWEQHAVVKIGIGVPTTSDGLSGDLPIEWSRRADAGGFSSLRFIDPTAHANYEVMATLGQIDRLREIV
jgi:hypothetical protein